MSNLVVADGIHLSADDQTDTGASLLEQSDYRLVIHTTDASPVDLSPFVINRGVYLECAKGRTRQPGETGLLGQS